jgi:hypothetical protein
MENDPVTQFAEALRDAALILKGDPVFDDRIHLEPRSTERFYLSTGAQTRAYLREMHSDQRLWGGCLYRFLHAKVTTQDGMTQPVGLDEPIRAEIKATSETAQTTPV